MKPIHFAHSMHQNDSYWIGFIERRESVTDSTTTVTQLGRFQIRVEEWESFKALMEPLATFGWEWN